MTEPHPIPLQVALDLIDRHLAWIAMDYRPADDAIYALQEDLKREAEEPGSSKPKTRKKS